MPGRALEVSLASPAIADSFGFWTRLGFVAAQTGDAWSHAYGVVTVTGLNLGLHVVPPELPTVTLVRADVAGLVPEFEARDVTLDDLRVGPDVFNEVRLHDPAGLPVRILEARTFSPPPASRPGLLGRFEAFSWPCTQPEAIDEFWGRLLVETEDPDGGWALRTADLGGLSVGWHAPGLSPEPLLVFRHDSLPAVHAALDAQGLTPGTRPLGLARPHLHLRTADGVRVVVLA